MPELEAELDHLRADGLLAFPTETVWGLAARATSAEAMDRLRAFKGRGTDHPVALLVSGSDELSALEFELGPAAAALMENFWPGPLTLVLACRSRFAPGVAGPEGGVGVRCSSHPIAFDLAHRCFRAGIGPLTATSLNRSGEPPAQTREEARKWVDESPKDAHLRLLDGPGDAGGGAPSTVIDLSTESPRVLREGALEIDAVQWLESRGLLEMGVS